MATFQSQINILAAANHNIHKKISDLESGQLKVEYKDTKTTIKDNKDANFITINNLGYNAYDAMLIMKNGDGGARKYHLMGYDGKILDLDKNPIVRSKIEKAMDAQTMKLLELTNISNEGELLRWSFEYTFNSEDEYVPLDETDLSINYPIFRNDKQQPITSDNLNTGNTLYIYNGDEPIKIIDGINLIDKVIYDKNKKPIGYRHLKNIENEKYYIKLELESIVNFTEELTITSNPTCKSSSDAILKYTNDDDDEITVELKKGDDLKILGYNEGIIYIGIGTNIISFPIMYKNILRLATSSTDTAPAQYCYIKIEKRNKDTLKFNNKEVNSITGSIDISFPWGSIVENKLELDDDDQIKTKIDRGHLWTETQDKFLNNNARYSNINIINNMNPLQFDIENETEGI